MTSYLVKKVLNEMEYDSFVGGANFLAAPLFNTILGLGEHSNTMVLFNRFYLLATLAFRYIKCDLVATRLLLVNVY